MRWGSRAIGAQGAELRALAHGQPDRADVHAETRPCGKVGTGERGVAETWKRGHGPRGHAGRQVRRQAGRRVRGHAGRRVRGHAETRKRGNVETRPQGHAGTRAPGHAGSRGPSASTALWGAVDRSREPLSIRSLCRRTTSPRAHLPDRTSAPAHQRRITSSRREPSPPLARRCIITGQPVADRQDHTNGLPQDGTAGGGGSFVVSRGTSSSRPGNPEKPRDGRATEDPDDASFLARSAATDPPLSESMASPPTLSSQGLASTDLAQWKTVLSPR